MTAKMVSKEEGPFSSSSLSHFPYEIVDDDDDIRSKRARRERKSFARENFNFGETSPERKEKKRANRTKTTLDSTF